MPPETNTAINPREFAANVQALLLEDPARYRRFGVYWYFVKALLAKFYSPENLYFLRGHEDASVIARMPKGLTASELMELAAEEYADNAAYNLDSAQVTDPEGERFTLLDPDVGL